jgi:hypothetical protein
MIYSNILNINFTFVFPSCKCVRLHFMTRYKIFSKFFLIKIFFTVKLSIFVEVHIWILLKVSDPTGSGSVSPTLLHGVRLFHRFRIYCKEDTGNRSLAKCVAIKGDMVPELPVPE